MDQSSFLPASDAPRAAGFPRLLADIGGTNARFVLELERGKFAAISVLPCKSYPTLSHAMRVYLQSPEAVACGASNVQLAAFAIANPVDGDDIKMTNHDWRFSIEAVRRKFGLASLLVVNDFKALAMALPYLSATEKTQVGGGVPQEQSVIGLVGVGTGIGVSALIPARDQWTALDSEGGHVTFTPSNEREIDILRHAWRSHSHVSAERVLAGIGLDLIYRALAEQAGKTAAAISVPEILRRALAMECEVCDQTVECFCELLGTLAGNLLSQISAQLPAFRISQPFRTQGPHVGLSGARADLCHYSRISGFPGRVGNA